MIFLKFSFVTVLVLGSVLANAKSEIKERRSIRVGGTPACALTVSYSGSEEQPVTWIGESCAKITVKFMSKKNLDNLGNYSMLTDETKGDIEALPGKRVLYVEGKQSASIYPMNVSGLLYEVSVND